MNNTKKIKHISHNDEDGQGCILLTEFIVESYPKGMFELDTVNILPNQLMGAIKKTLNEITSYDLIIITDLAISQDIADIISQSGYAEKFLIFDHHQTTIDLDNYKQMTIQKNFENTNIQTCATAIYFDFLKSDTVFDIRLLHLPSMHQINFFIDCVTSWDTKSFLKTGNDEIQYIELYGKEYWEHIKIVSPKLNILFHILDKDEFKSYIKDYITNVDFDKIKKNVGVLEFPYILSLSDNNSKIQYIYEDTHIDIPTYAWLAKSTDRYPWIDKLIELEEKRNKKYIESAVKRTNIISLNKQFHKDGTIHKINAIVGLIFAERNATDIAELANNTYPEIDFCAIVSNNQVGLYTIKENINVGQIAALLGGGGHKKAAGFTIEHNDSNWFNKAHFNAMFNCAANIAIPVK